MSEIINESSANSLDSVQLTENERKMMLLCQRKLAQSEAYYLGSRDAIQSLMKEYLASRLPPDGDYELNKEGTALVRVTKGG